MFLSFQKVLSYVLLFSFFPNYFLFVYLKYGPYLFKGLIFLVSVLVLVGLGFSFLNYDIIILAGRYRGLLGNPNGLGLFLYLFIILFAIINERFPHVFSKAEIYFVYGICFISLLKCGARSSLLAVMMFFFFKRFYKLSPILGFFIFLITLFIYQLVSQNLVDIILALGLGDQLRVNTIESGSGRLIAWEFAWQKIQDNFYIGNGFNYTEYIYRQNYEYLSKLGHQGSAHNSYLTIWLDTGLIGLLCFLMGLLFMFLKAAKRSTLAIPFLYTVLFSNYFESWLTASLNPFTIQFLLIVSMLFLPLNEDEFHTSEPVRDDEMLKKIA
ncbi:MAG: O-antigen ligase family protein [Bacteroidota bacterium]